MRRTILVALLLSGCATVAPQSQFPQQAAALQQSCAQQFQPQLPDAHQRFAACYNSGIAPLRAQSGYPYPDLAALEDNYRMLVAQQRDAGAINDAQVGVYMAELRTRIASEEQARMGQAALVEQQERQADAASWAAISQGLALMNQANQPPPRQGFTCTQMGNTTNCW
ncbi:MAG TPA: hypothetical protein VNS22_11995 [Geminicoccus sp.]|uniref:hypothetical protein n=1 Tax=Geminicoccus sp. TaxID=2024832 RepID=UPI002B716061|nr:hypothetical protein [Geminicoccus sp.]HWL69093.1 hypothetical protein [Geminicoccus sp.]